MSEVSICNSALIKLGAKRIVSLDDASKEARLCKEQYPKLRDKLLRSHHWNFATKRVELAEVSTAPVYQFDKAYQLPGDFLKIVDTDITGTIVRADLGIVSTSLADDQEYRIEGDKLLTNAAPVKINYIAKVTDTTLFESNFDEVLALLIAADIAYAITNSQSVADRLARDYKTEFREARAIDAQQGTAQKPLEGSWIPTRFS